MAEKEDIWARPCERYVAFLDIMGFKERLLRDGHEEVGKMLKGFRSIIDQVEDEAKNEPKSRRKKTKDEDEIFGNSIVMPVLFSDSILLVSSDDSKYSANNILFCVEWIFEQAILQGIPIKGAISHGIQTALFHESLYFGRPLIDSYDLQKEILLYGVVLHHTMEKHISDIGILPVIEDFDLFRYAVPTNKGKINHYLVDWITLPSADPNIIEAIIQLYDSVSGTPRRYVDNTIEFARWLVRKRAEIAQKEKSSKRPTARKKKTTK